MPPATIGIVGGGQLGQMMALAAKQMGYKVGVLDPGINCSAGQVADFQITAEYADHQALMELSKKCDVLTYEFENVDVSSLKEAQAYTSLPQGTALLTITGNRINEKNFLKKNGISVTDFTAISDESELAGAIKLIGYPSILKTADGGYDGHGQQNLNSVVDLEASLKLIRQAGCILEKRQPFVKELSVMVTRSLAGNIQIFPVTENIHHHHILYQSIIPARIKGSITKHAQQIAVTIAEKLNLRGVLGVELFLLPNGKLLVNELAPRPHNSGHYSIEACNISQFEAHIRSICGLEIPLIKLNSPAVMMNLLGQHLESARQLMPSRPQWHFHDYGKTEIRQDRKMGHITLVGNDLNKLLAEINQESIWEA
ncbi:phosphoribosylaminoimidazole carboxylase ATPase subunit [Paucilactobacillus hokkaidonensis]|uniref:N5-carboxyaminoimidazole ribonucleotide synthase n=1 Tax=Paucilactobacillus hokkaidonensis TaxID=1193095 RepID=A0ABR5Q895_9LACO|nr:phosphoribosylaminoimidazole carboxylase ATPase subunit [Paucilactobacillus hokkaidonensis]